MSDGCGGQMDCGTCGTEQTCGNSVPSVCGAPSGRGGELNWFQILSTPEDECSGGIALDDDGRLLTFWYAESERRFRLDSVGASRLSPLGTFPLLPAVGGDEVWRYQVYDCGLRSASAGPLFVTVSLDMFPLSPHPLVDLGDGPRPGEQLVALDRDGAFGRTVLTAASDVGAGGEYAAVAPDGDALLYVSGGAGLTSGIRLDRADGTRIALVTSRTSPPDFVSVSEGPLASVGCAAATFVQEDIVCVGRADGVVALGPSVVGIPGARSVVLVRLDRHGAVKSAMVVPGVSPRARAGGALIQILRPLSSGGFAVAGSFHGSVQFGSTILGEGGETATRAFVGVVGADGAPRWAREVGAQVEDLAVGPADGLVLATREEFLGLGRIRLDAFDAAGTLRWTRSLPGYAEYPPYGPQRASLAVSGSEVVVAAGWSGMFAFGAGPITSRGVDAFIVALAW